LLGTTLADTFRRAAALELHVGVPEAVRSCMNAVKTLFVYGWFYYPFYGMIPFQASSVVEMALRLRIPWTSEGEDSRGLRNLLEQANKLQLLHEDGFHHLLAARAEAREIARAMHEVGQAWPVPDE